MNLYQDPDYPQPVEGDNWTPAVKPLKSAYLEFQQREPGNFPITF